MHYPAPLVRATFKARRKRFFADVVLEDGRSVTAHCPNSGRMTGCLADEAPAWLLPATNPRRLLPFTLEQIEVDGARILVNTLRANELVAEAIAEGRVPELRGYDRVRREVSLEQGSRIDLVLEGQIGRCFVEVKSVTLPMGEGRGAFPDAVTERGRRHLRALTALARAGESAVLFYCAGRTDLRSVAPADHVDPGYGAALREAELAGVRILAWRVGLDERGAALVAPIEVTTAPAVVSTRR